MSSTGRSAAAAVTFSGGGARIGWGAVDDWEARIGVEARRGEESGADVSVEERVAAVPVRSGDPLRLGEGVDGEAALPLEPALAALDCDDLRAHIFRRLHCGQFGGYTDAD